MKGQYKKLGIVEHDIFSTRKIPLLAPSLLVGGINGYSGSPDSFLGYWDEALSIGVPTLISGGTSALIAYALRKRRGTQVSAIKSFGYNAFISGLTAAGCYATGYLAMDFVTEYL